MDNVRFPTGKFEYSEPSSGKEMDRWIERLEQLPGKLQEEVAGMTDTQLDTPYRENGWTVRQVVHHLPDSHLNGYTRIKLALTEEEPVIKPYDQDRWAALADSTLAVRPSLVLLDGIHTRLAALLKSLTGDEWDRIVRHPESGKISVKFLAALYAWHGDHHLAHITNLKERHNW